ncbi:flagellar M-ring protein FliF [Rhodovulum bhavnagarense]|uniref:Flagellar M-ring protein n=1 Tax=Rhodovulum bhavnagarense TaxID=992286 RepID=A0A4V2SW59_9RHOB|nr:flagellar basal-body MS-ring/collar protein FliF [Rhodovulum bhavnagarense]TCP61176.1 flagellar M-ring protein FliF [Rhodovulum bhavnagarense]
MQQVIAVWNGLTHRQKVIVAITTVVVFAAVLGLSRMAGSPRLALLYSGLDPAAAGEILRALDQGGIAYEVRGSAIYADARQRDGLRLTLASEGLPANGPAGYELLDGLSGFATTSQMFDAAYWRAKEGELARTILANPAYRAARVHIATPSSRPFARDIAPSAAVTVRAAGSGIAPRQARALRYLVASSVAGLAPEDVSVIDGDRGTVIADDTAQGVLADSREAALKARLERILTARLGPGRAVVEISIETETETESIRERRVDPEARVAISAETEERATTANDTGGGAVTVASNLPDGDAGTARSSQQRETETRERVNYDISETEREILRLPGAIRRLSIAVLVGGTTEQGPDGTPIWAPLPEEALSDLRDLIASAVGYDEARGDVITLKSMPLEAPAEDGTGPRTAWFEPLRLDPMTMIQLAILAIVAMVLGLFVIRPILSGSHRLPPGLPAPTGPAGAQAWLSGEIDPVDSGHPDDTDGLAVASLPAPGEDPVARLREAITERREESMAILRSWMEDTAERA